MPAKNATGSKAKKAPPKPKGGPRGMAKPINAGLVMTDLVKKQWKLGPVIGQGGFGYIYLGDTFSDKDVTLENANQVIKVEPHANGPLFVELAFYQRVAKADMVNTWMKENKSPHLGIPLYIASGSFDHDGIKYRFMVMDRYGCDVEKLYKECNYQFPEKTVYSLGLRVLDTLQYIHDHEYVHADIKSSNLMMGFKKANQSKLYVLDYGLAYRYCPNGTHVKYKEDPKRKHDGTIEYTSRDAHKGLAPSRRGDLEILGYCMVQWLCKRLPWEDKLADKDYVMKQKNKYMDDLSSFMSTCFGNSVPVPLLEYLKLINKLGYEEKPNYKKIKSLFNEGLKLSSLKDDGVSVLLPSVTSPSKKRGRPKANESGSPNKRSRLTKNSPAKLPVSNQTAGAKSPKKPKTVRKTALKVVSPKKAIKDSKSRAAKIRSPSNGTLVTLATKEVSNIKTVKRNSAGNGSSSEQKVVHKRPRRKNVPTRDFGQSP